MFDIFKVNYIVKNEIKKIYVFFGSRKLSIDGNEVNLNEEELYVLFKKEHSNKIFENIFSEDELKHIMNEEKETHEITINIPLEFVKIYIHIDDTIEDIKKKVIHIFKSAITFDEIYLYGVQKQKHTASSIYKKLTNNNKIELTKNRIIHYLFNIYKGNLDDIIEKLEDKIYTYNDLLKLDIEQHNLLTVCLSQKISTNDVKYNFITNPYDCDIYDEELDRHSENYISTLNSNLLLDFGKMEYNTIYLVLASDIYSNKTLTEHVNSKYITKIYFPFLYKQNIFTEEHYDLQKQTLLSQNKKLLNDVFMKKMRSIDLFYNLNPELNIDPIEEMKYTKKGINYINFVLHQNADINIPLENIFKLINSTKEIPLIIYNMGSKKEGLVRLFIDTHTEDGSKLPYLSKNSIIKVMKYGGINKKVSFYIELSSCKIFCNINNSGMINIRVDCNETLLISEIEQIIIKNINPIITTIQNYIEQSGYKLQLFENFESPNIEIIDLKYII